MADFYRTRALTICETDKFLVLLVKPYFKPEIIGEFWWVCPKTRKIIQIKFQGFVWLASRKARVICTKIFFFSCMYVKYIDKQYWKFNKKLKFFGFDLLTAKRSEKLCTYKLKKFFFLVGLYLFFFFSPKKTNVYKWMAFK